MLKISGDNLLLVFLGVVALVHGIYVVKDECPPNEEYLLCGSACAANCSTLNSTDVCTEDCVEGCFCNLGLVRNDNGTCVSPDQCGKKQGDTPPSCPNNKVYKECGTACPETCATGSGPLVCTFQCVRGCFCPSSLVDDGNGNCVTLDNCPPEPCLNENEVYDTCKGECEPSCFDPEPLCNKMCTGGCICSPGLLRNDAGDCVAVDKCPTNGTDIALISKYLNAINNILHV